MGNRGLLNVTTLFQYKFKLNEHLFLLQWGRTQPLTYVVCPAREWTPQLEQPSWGNLIVLTQEGPDQQSFRSPNRQSYTWLLSLLLLDVILALDGRHGTEQREKRRREKAHRHNRRQRCIPAAIPLQKVPNLVDKNPFIVHISWMKVILR